MLGDAKLENRVGQHAVAGGPFGGVAWCPPAWRKTCAATRL